MVEKKRAKIIRVLTEMCKFNIKQRLEKGGAPTPIELITLSSEDSPSFQKALEIGVIHKLHSGEEAARKVLFDFLEPTEPKYVLQTKVIVIENSKDFAKNNELWDMLVRTLHNSRKHGIVLHILNHDLVDPDA